MSKKLNIIITFLLVVTPILYLLQPVDAASKKNKPNTSQQGEQNNALNSPGHNKKPGVKPAKPNDDGANQYKTSSLPGYQGLMNAISNNARGVIDAAQGILGITDPGSGGGAGSGTIEGIAYDMWLIAPPCTFTKPIEQINRERSHWDGSAAVDLNDECLGQHFNGPVKASIDGILTKGVDVYGGLFVDISGTGDFAGIRVRYVHLSKYDYFGNGAHVQVGQRIGDIGRTGNATGNHIHFEVCNDVPEGLFYCTPKNHLSYAEWLFAPAEMSGPPGSIYRQYFEENLEGHLNRDGFKDTCIRVGITFTCDTNNYNDHEYIWDFGFVSDMPLMGDVDGDQIDEICLFRPKTSTFYCDTGRNGGAAEFTVSFGDAREGDVPLLGDVNGDKRDDICVYRAPESRFMCDTDRKPKTVDFNVVYGNANSDIPWIENVDGDVMDEICVVRGKRHICSPNNQTGTEGVLNPQLRPVFRFWSESYGDHHYTTDRDEMYMLNSDAAWNYEGVGFWVYELPGDNSIPIHRYYNTNTRNHLFTRDPSGEIPDVQNQTGGWVYEQVGFYAPTSSHADTTPVRRMYSETLESHFYTPNTVEVAEFELNGWRKERNEFYAVVSGKGAVDQPPFPTISSIAEKYAPIIKLHPDDKYRPSTVAWYLPRVEMRYDVQGGILGKKDTKIYDVGEVNLNTLLAGTHKDVNDPKHDCPDYPEGHQRSKMTSGDSRCKSDFFLEIGGNKNEREKTRMGQPVNSENGYQSPAQCYVEVLDGVSSNLPNESFKLNYWLYYPYNGKPGGILGAHESDWERITVQGTLGEGVTRVNLSAHEGGNVFKQAPTEVEQEEGIGFLTELTWQGDSLLAYSAKDSHANYHKPGSYGIGGSDETAHDVHTLDCNGNFVLIGTAQQPTPGMEWIQYSGRWGEIGENGWHSGKYGPGF